jgi:hypothetical protein
MYNYLCEEMCVFLIAFGILLSDIGHWDDVLPILAMKDFNALQLDRDSVHVLLRLQGVPWSLLR